MLPLPPEEPTVLCDDMLLSALRVRLLIERRALAEELAFPPILILCSIQASTSVLTMLCSSLMKVVARDMREWKERVASALEEVL